MRWQKNYTYAVAGLMAAVALKIAAMHLGPSFQEMLSKQAVDEETEAAAKEDNSTQEYRPPSIEGLHWVETFDGDAMSRWPASSREKYGGRFEVGKRRRESLTGDLGLLAPAEARHYGVSTSFPAIVGTKEVPFVFSFEVQFQDGLQCGGSYVKMFDRKGQKAEDFDNDTPYIIMFGPDRCGGTDKVHFILQHQSPKTGKWEEKHFKEIVKVPDDHLTHLYGLVIHPDNYFEVWVDGAKKASGDLLKDLSPAINPPQEVDDPADSKPSDWIDEAKMDDPTSSKPEDWDEDEPFSIPDPSAKMPSGWREDVTEKKLPDPSAKIPADWDEEEDGEWEAPTIDNPACEVGCGKWSAPTINNNKYKGKWSAPKVDNPAYKGVWKPKQIANPDYFDDKTPCILPKIDSIGIDIWTMQGNIMFDNFMVATDFDKAAAFVEQTWRIRSNIEELQKPKKGARSIWDMGRGEFVWDTFMRYPLHIAITAAVLFFTVLFWCFCCRGEATVPPRERPHLELRTPQDPSERKRDATPPLTKAEDPQDEDKEEEEKKDD